MAYVDVDHLVKSYKVAEKDKGLKGALQNLVHKQTKIVKAVNDISFSIEKGEIVAFIGPNGAGKSTTVKMMSGILSPTAGEVMINGLSPQKNRKQVVKNLGVVFGQRTQLNWDLRLGESFELLKRIYQIPDKTYQDNLSIMDDILGINKIINTPVRQLSLGQRMKGDLAAAMLHSPALLFLDEPTIGLDVEAKCSIRKFIKEINDTKQTTIILTTHDLGDVQELCSRMIIINQGVIIEDGSLSELVDRIAPYRQLVVEFYEKSNNVTHPQAEIIEQKELKTVYRFGKKDITAAKLIEDISKMALIKDIHLEEAKIEDIIRIAYNK